MESYSLVLGRGGGEGRGWLRNDHKATQIDDVTKGTPAIDNRTRIL